MAAETVLVTGISSFVGCHIAEAFVAAGYRVVGTYVTPPRQLLPLRRARWERCARILDHTIKLDLRDAGDVRGAALDIRPDVWVQLAGIGQNFASQHFDIEAAGHLDLVSLGHLFPALAEIGSSLIATGSGMEYGGDSPSHAEESICLPNSPYGLFKLMMTLRLRQLAARYTVPTRVGRLYTVFGELDDTDRLVARIISRLKAGQAIGLAPRVSRDICDIRDVGRGFVRLSETRQDGPVFDLFNLSRGTATPLRVLASCLATELGASEALICDDAAMQRPDEPLIIEGNSDKAERLLSWKPQPIELGLRHLVQSEAG